MLPGDLPLSALPPVSYDRDRKSVPWAIDELDLAPVTFDPKAEPHLVIFGAPQSGKSTTLRVVIDGLLKRYTPQEAKFLVLDYRRSLLGFIPDEYLIRYAPSQQSGIQACKDVAPALTARVPGPDVTPQQLRDKSWWKGLEVFVVVDDYDLVATSMSNALQPFVEFVSLASDIGFHLLIARGMGGAGRAVMDPIVGRIKDAANPR